MTILSSLNKALKGVNLDGRDLATVELAKRYARIIDHDKDNAWTWRYGPRLLDALVELGMTPKARASVLHGGRLKDDDDDGPDTKSALDKLRSRRERRAAP